MRSLPLRIRVHRQRPDEMHQIPDVFVGFHSPKRGHAAQTNSIFHNPKQLAVGILLYVGRSEVRRSRVHPSPRVGWVSSGVTVALRAFRTEEIVPFLDTCPCVSRSRRDARTTGSSNKKMLMPRRNYRLSLAQLPQH